MSEKMTCPACTSHTSSVLSAYREGEPCPYCGLTVDATQQILTIQRSKASEDVKRMAQEAVERAARAEAEVRRLERIVERVNDALHEGDDPSIIG